MKKFWLRIFFLLFLTFNCIACGFHLQGEMELAPALNRLYLRTSDPYGYFSRSLRQYLKLSNVQLTCSALEADTILVILQDNTSQALISVSVTQQTRQYNLKVTVIFEITDARGIIIVPPQVITENRVITIQSNQILGSSNEVNLYYQQMRRTLAYTLMNRLASREITHMINDACLRTIPARKPS